MVALSLGSGKRLWTANEGPLNPIWPAGGSLFLVSDRNELLRLSAQDGSRIWGQPLPLFTARKPKRQAGIVGHYGPVLAGGQLFVASADEKLRVFDPVSGQLTRTVPLPGGPPATRWWRAERSTWSPAKGSFSLSVEAAILYHARLTVSGAAT
jgi:outer membrane protein assembly factor BamB